MKCLEKRLRIPKGYKPKLDLLETEIGIKQIKDHFERTLAKKLDLTRVSAPLFVRPETGLNDNLNGVERPVSFDVLDIEGKNVEIVHSLAKWKRMALAKYGFKKGKGLYTDMNAIRRDEELDNLHSIYVDQWDWEKIISKEERNVDTLKKIVRIIYSTLKETEEEICNMYPVLEKQLPDNIHFVTTQELEDRYPSLTPKQREDTIAKEKGAVFIMQIGGKLKSGIKHDGRSPDYDDWTLNGDIILWYPVLETAFEISSMGIRVDEDTLEKQLKLAKCEERKNLPFHQAILKRELPYTVGGGIGQSRMCMYLLQKAHIGEVQASVWSKEMIEVCGKANIKLL
ncbi:aspartate--ammonia ligase [Caldisalinibacter kiritimatiensis]|uniref:Aspartate--ammonia ligase n=1 Tax=Caldisalinibacter kiritimatiensis TaxID=1304284 RepID=R1AUJ6_9FIRM|nr:aspartate--ammonia ligase [Caldisalinibacter kiritimatiensis]EOD00833.1 Aspartate--ammonia ligase [Caldisalinibacter kiritimatiensis]